MKKIFICAIIIDVSFIMVCIFLLYKTKQEQLQLNSYYEFLTATYPETVKEYTGASMEELQKEITFTMLDVNHDGIKEIIILPYRPCHASGYIEMYAYVNGSFKELPLSSDGLIIFNEGELYVTLGVHQGIYDVHYISFDGINDNQILYKNYSTFPYNTEEDVYQIDGMSATKEETSTYEINLLKDMESHKCIILGGDEVYLEALCFDENIKWQVDDNRINWCNLEPYNVENYLKETLFY